MKNFKVCLILNRSSYRYDYDEQMKTFYDEDFEVGNLLKQLEVAKQMKLRKLRQNSLNAIPHNTIIHHDNINQQINDKSVKHKSREYSSTKVFNDELNEKSYQLKNFKETNTDDDIYLCPNVEKDSKSNRKLTRKVEKVEEPNKYDEMSFNDINVDSYDDCVYEKVS